MNTLLKTIKKEKLINACASAKIVIQRYPNTKIEHWCTRFFEANEKAIRVVEKQQNKLIRPFQNELRDFIRINALEKDGIAVLTEDKKSFEPKDASSAVLINRKNDEVSEKIEEVLEKFIEEEVEIRVFVSETELPDKFEANLFRDLNGMCFKQNTSQFSEEEVEVTK